MLHMRRERLWISACTCATCCLVRGHGTASNRSASPTTRSSRVPFGGRSRSRRGRPGPEARHRHDGRARDEREVRRAALRGHHVAAPAGALRVDRDHSPAAEQPQRLLHGTRVESNRSTSIWPIFVNPNPIGPVNIDSLTIACTPRVAAMNSSGPSR